MERPLTMIFPRIAELHSPAFLEIVPFRHIRSEPKFAQRH
jgi:hypothetical protein